MTFTLFVLLSLSTSPLSGDDTCPDERAAQVDARVDEVNPNDVLQQMEILKQKNKALEKNMGYLQEMNAELSERVNATELAKNQIMGQSSTSVLSQANNISRDALKLIG